jgi:hypothetical protein
MLTVVCWLWSDPEFRFRSKFRFTPEHVERLRIMLQRHLSLPHRLVCLTDHSGERFHPDVEVIPMWSDLASHGGCYRRLKVFSEEMRPLLGDRFLSIDLDVVITGSVDHVFSRPEPFIIWDDINPRQPYCGSMFMMNTGCRSRVWETFNRCAADELKERYGYIGTDQAWIASVLSPNEVAKWTRADGVYSALEKRIRPKLSGPATQGLPGNSAMVFFHGKRDPSMIETQMQHPWVAEHYGGPFETRSTHAVT